MIYAYHARNYVVGLGTNSQFETKDSKQNQILSRKFKQESKYSLFLLHTHVLCGYMSSFNKNHLPLLLLLDIFF